MQRANGDTAHPIAHKTRCIAKAPRAAACHVHIAFPRRPVLVSNVVTQPRCCGKPGHFVPQRGDDVSFWPQMLIQPSLESTAERAGLLLRHPQQQQQQQAGSDRDNELSCPNSPVNRITGSSSMKVQDKGLLSSFRFLPERQ